MSASEDKAQDMSADAVAAATEHAQAIEIARKAQLDEAVQAHKEETLQIFTKAMRAVLTQGDEGTKSLLIQKIPLLCTDILSIKSDIRWIKWIGSGIVAGIGLIALKALGA